MIENVLTAFINQLQLFCVNADFNLSLSLCVWPLTPTRWSTSRGVWGSGWRWPTAARCPIRSWGWWWWPTPSPRPPSTRSASTARCSSPGSTWTWRSSTARTGRREAQVKGHESSQENKQRFTRRSKVRSCVGNRNFIVKVWFLFGFKFKYLTLFFSSEFKWNNFELSWIIK